MEVNFFSRDDLRPIRSWNRDVAWSSPAFREGQALVNGAPGSISGDHRPKRALAVRITNRFLKTLFTLTGRMRVCQPAIASFFFRITPAAERLPARSCSF